MFAERQWTKSVASQWGLFIPPARPSISELAVIEQHLLRRKKDNNNLRVAILGSTPEYRDVCQRYGIFYRCIDYAKANFATLRQYMCHKDTDECLLQSDWRDMNFTDSFDIFLGDLATTVTPVRDHAGMFVQIAAHLSTGGEVLLKVVLREYDTRLSHDEIFTRYRSEYSHLPPFAAVWREVLLADYDFSADTMNCRKSEAALRASRDIGIITEAEYQSFKLRWDALGDFNMNVPLRERFFDSLAEQFSIAEVAGGQDWYAKHIPIVIASKR